MAQRAPECYRTGKDAWNILSPHDIPRRWQVLHVSVIVISDLCAHTDSVLINFDILCRGFKFSQLEMKVILAMLIENFKLEPAKCADDIFWEMTAIAAPIVRGSGEHKHKLPIKVSVLAK
jgi:hypothetical protein